MANIPVNTLPTQPPVKTDSFMGIGSAQEYQATLQDLDSLFGASANNLLGVNARDGWADLAGSDDLDGLTTVGIYSAGTDAIASSITGAPDGVSVPFRVVVEYAKNNASYLRQTLQTATADTQDQVWRRLSVDGGNTWGSWLRDATSAEIAITQSVIDAFAAIGIDLSRAGGVVEALQLLASSLAPTLNTGSVTVTSNAGGTVNNYTVYDIGLLSFGHANIKLAASIAAGTGRSIGVINAPGGRYGRGIVNGSGGSYDLSGTGEIYIRAAAAFNAGVNLDISFLIIRQP